MKIALVHDYLTQFGGGEKVLSALCEMFPEAPIYTLIYDEKKTDGAFKNRKITTSFLQKIPGSKKYFRYFIPLMPLAIEQFDFSDFNLVISVSHSFGKGIITKPETKHICYCLTPTRYLWHNPGLPFKPISKFILTFLRMWDYQAAQRVDYFIADSENVRERIKKYYNRDSNVIYPPVDTAKFKIGKLKLKIDNYFLMVGRMVPYKRFDIAIEAFSKLPNENLIVIGDGPDRKNLELRTKNLEADNIKFIGRIPDDELVKYYADCKALIFPQEEDFGIVPLEAMASGRPVIAYRAGGALEIIKDRETGSFFNEQASESLIQGIRYFDHSKFDPEKIRKHSLRFDKRVFKKKITEVINNLT